ncbi:MAG TPA: class I SAM-dependent methyltransferase [Candidatus Bathyarchaeia archaeon]|nr:class I SAM-dependent methyltransferase [Candidatus Bathyarchaeia archaeon]
MTGKSDKYQTIDTYNKTAKIHSQKFENYGARIEDIEKAFSYIDKSNPKVIDIGCGDGRDAKEITKKTDDYLGIDLSVELIKIARKKVPRGNFIIADFETFEYPQGVDIVFAFAAILHSGRGSVKKLLKKVYRSLTPGGIFFISTKYGSYRRKVIDRDGPKVNFLYRPEDIIKMSPAWA